MKRLALLLGSLLVVSAAASAKEVVPAPVVVEEAPVQIVEKEVIVYRDKEEGFRPNGYVDLQYKWYGDTEGKGHSADGWNGNNNYSRTQLEGMIQMTEKQRFDFRVRDYNSLDYNDEGGSKLAGSKENGTETRLRYYYDHGTFGDTKVGMNSFVRYEKSDSSSQELEYGYAFQFADYLFDNDYVKTTNLEVRPRVKYAWDADNSSNYGYSVGLYIDWINQLPWGFSTEVEIDGFDFTTYGNGGRPENVYSTPYVDSLDLSVLALIKHDANLYSTDKLSIDWHGEAGYDTYNWSNREVIGHNFGEIDIDKLGNRDAEYSKYYAKIVAELNATYKATEFVNLYAGVGAEYGNYVSRAQENATNWRWQPYVWAGFRTAF